MNGSWDQRFMDLAHHVAQWSKDPSTKVGSVIVDDDKRVIGIGFNGFPRGVHDYIHRYDDRDTKLRFVAHAERNALDNATLSTKGATLYSTLMPCCDCAKGIIQCGIKRVVTSKPIEDKPYFNFDVTETMFNEAGVELEFINITT